MLPVPNSPVILYYMSQKKIDLNENLLIRCDCHAFEFIDFGWFDDEEKIFYVTITHRPKGLLDRFKAVIRALRGSEYMGSDEVIINDKEAKRLAKWLNDKIK